MIKLELGQPENFFYNTCTFGMIQSEQNGRVIDFIVPFTTL